MYLQGRLQGIHECINVDMKGVSKEHHLFIHDKDVVKVR